MLKPREADIPALFVVLVVLPLVTYILLGKWNEAAKKKARISVLAQLAAEETCRIEAMATADVMPAVSSTKTLIHLCARCYGPATTRCSRCKSVRYCSGKCQIIHWRQGHKQECQQMDGTNSSPYANLDSVANSLHQEVMLNENTKSPFLRSHHVDEPMPDSNFPDTSFQPPIMVAAMFATPSSATETPQISTAERKLSDNKRVSQKFDCEMMMSSEAASCNSFKETNSSGVATSILMKKKDDQESLNWYFPSYNQWPITDPVGNGSSSSDEIPMKLNNNGSPVSVHGHTISNPRNVMYPPYKLKTKSGSSFESKSISGISASLHPGKSRINAYEIITNVTATMDKEIPQKMACSTIPAQHSNGISTLGDVKNVGLKKLSKILRRDAAGRTSNSLKKIKVLFPYEEFVKLFHYEVWDLFPRGLLNCGNSCYANAVLQCLTCTKPLISYLLQRAHSRACWVSGWCLMCELEQHVSMLREGRGPLSPSTILSHMQNTGTQMGGGDQEDAHEFLRLLVTSMQSICLEGLGGEKEIDIMLQETTLIQQIFGGRLRSKVKCLRCHHESERYENIMDLTLEILGWVESLEDALTQFTSPEDLDGENMYRCGRCKAYVKARKQLSVHEAPNILTIVLKRFQTGKYGKINKCITFPDMLDMIPFMTGTSDSPPLYMLYGVVVHLDTLNASFSGHYVSYVKDLQGTWFRIDDTEVEPVPMSQVMSEGAYILFYSRSYPRPPRDYTGRPPLQAPPYSKHCTTKAQKSSSRYGQSKQKDVLVASEQSPVHAANMGNYLREETSTGISYGTIDHSTRTGRNVLPTRQTYSMDFSDTTSSDWSLFTSSDESSFTTESTRDSFSTVDYGDLHNMDPVFTIFNPYSVPEYSNSNVSCTKFSPCKPQTRFFLESSGLVLDSSMSTEPFDKCT